VAGYRTQSLDTAPEIERRLLDARRRLTSVEKARRFDEAYLAVRRLAIAGLRLRHPAAAERELELRYLARHLPADVMRRAFAWPRPADQP
jgi:hypothetical protein